MNDPYFSTERCVERLLTQYEKYGSLIVATDFDDTVFDFHKMGHKYPEVISLLKRCNEAGFHLAIFTASTDDRYPFIQKHMEELGIKIDAINKNPIEGLAFGHHGKIFYNILLDDRAGLGQSVEILTKVLDSIHGKKSN